MTFSSSDGAIVKDKKEREREAQWDLPQCFYGSSMFTNLKAREF